MNGAICSTWVGRGGRSDEGAEGGAFVDERWALIFDTLLINRLIMIDYPEVKRGKRWFGHC